MDFLHIEVGGRRTYASSVVDQFVLTLCTCVRVRVYSHKVMNGNRNRKS